jgi:hypothetical protein
MEKPAIDSIGVKIRDQAGVARALASGVKTALERHRKLGERVAIWRDGKAVLVSAEEAMGADNVGTP